MFKSAKFDFLDGIADVEVYSHERGEMYALSIAVDGRHLEWQVSSVAQIFNSLSPTFSAVAHLTFEHTELRQSFEEHNVADPTEWRKLSQSI